MNWINVNVSVKYQFNIHVAKESDPDPCLRLVVFLVSMFHMHIYLYYLFLLSSGPTVCGIFRQYVGVETPNSLHFGHCIDHSLFRRVCPCSYYFPVGL